jgi:PleD family two-component response regulator
LEHRADRFGSGLRDQLPASRFAPSKILAFIMLLNVAGRSACGGNMSNVAMRILLVGRPSTHTSAVLARLLQRGYGSHDAGTLAEAGVLLETFQFDVVLAPEHLSEGRGYELAARVAAQ